MDELVWDIRQPSLDAFSKSIGSLTNSSGSNSTAMGYQITSSVMRSTALGSGSFQGALNKNRRHPFS
ncbi:MAG: hypothetical protein ABI855_00945 [Bacteroidota bacterium]